jgi:hypothetical protein
MQRNILQLSVKTSESIDVIELLLFSLLKSMYTSKNGIAANPKAISLLTVNETRQFLKPSIMLYQQRD